MTACPLPPGQVASPQPEAQRLAREQGVTKCPSCGARQLGCFMREAEIGSWCCGDCTAHHGQHEWNDDTDPNRPEELA